MKSILPLIRAARKNEYVSFTYKKETGEVSRRTVRFGTNIPKKLERQGTPINGRGGWMTGRGTGLKSMVVKRDGKVYVRGTDLKGNIHKIFIVENISEIKGGKE
jgi:hypothetical protein